MSSSKRPNGNANGSASTGNNKKARTQAEKDASKFKTALTPTGYALPGASTVSNVELKYIDAKNTVGSPVTVLATGATYNVLLNATAEGNDINNRVGRVVRWKTLLFRFMAVPANATNPSAILRVALIWDGYNNGSSSAPVQADIWQTTSPLSPNNLDNRARYKVIRDWVIPFDRFDSTGGVNTGVCWTGTVKYEDCFHRFGEDANTIYKDVTAVQSSIQQGALWLIMYTNTGSAFSVDYHSRLRYTDV